MNLFKLSFWFNFRPVPLLAISQNILWGVAFLFLLFSFLLRLGKSRNKILYQNFFTFSTVNFFIALILIFFNYESVYFLAARFWFFLWGIEILVWLVSIFKKLKEIPERKKKIAEEKEYKKYIP